MSELILYRTPDGKTDILLRAADGSVWLTQAEMAELFQTTKQNISLHLKNVFHSEELEEGSVVKVSLTTASDGKTYQTQLYRLEAILAVGYRINSPRGVQFRQWATTVLKEYLVKGFVINDERLKNPATFDYFDELLERIREIRASEKRFYQKVRDIYATSVDYDPQSDAAQTFFATVQNKMIYAITGNTAAEVITRRADAGKPNMGLTSWHGSRVRKGDVTTAKNYLDDGEVADLNRIVTMFLDYAEDQAMKRKALTMREWEEKVDGFLAFNERALLGNAGSVSADQAKKVAHQRYETFDTARAAAEHEEAEKAHLAELEKVESEARKTLPAQNDKKTGSGE